MTEYGRLGLRVGLEIHQELDTEHKLFCSCPTMLFKGEPEYKFLRRLRPSQSELGEVDPAALFEFRKGKTMLYEADRDTDCLVEMDEEPPHRLDPEALDIALTLALMTGSTPVDEVQVMRKTVVDGSNTGGFQRTCVVSLGGSVEAGGRVYGLEQIALEEDAARKMGEEDEIVRYRIDRLGIPLVEVTTSPDIHTPKEAEEVARRIGSILRATGRVRRGLGTIRQDLNVSIEGGAVIEIKGVQELNLLSTIVEYEAQRQSTLLELAEELRKRGVKPSDIQDEVVGVSDVFEPTKCGIIRGALKRGRGVYAVRLLGFAGVVGRELCHNRRLGTEMADRARFWGGVRGIFHTDELPGYDVSAEEVAALRNRVGAGDGDAVVIVADEEGRSRDALSAVVERAREALEGVPAETRSANPDGTTHFTRPRPGAARMYPETDVVAISIAPERLGRLRDGLPEMPEAKLERFKRDYGLNEKLARQVVDSEYMGLFEKLAKETGVSTTLIAVTLTEELKRLERDGVQVGELTDEAIMGVFDLIDRGLTVKESIPDILSWLAGHPDAEPCEALRALGLGLLSEDELRRMIQDKIQENMEMVERMGERAAGPLMGMVMGDVRGRARAGEAQRLIREALRDALRPESEGRNRFS